MLRTGRNSVNMLRSLPEPYDQTHLISLPNYNCEGMLITEEGPVRTHGLQLGLTTKEDP